jgi:uncharacterized MAPEG superfamily protein
MVSEQKVGLDLSEVHFAQALVVTFCETDLRFVRTAGMLSSLSALLFVAALTWTMLVVAALARTRFWTLAGLKTAFGNRDELGKPSAFAERADRAAKNMVENLPLFAAVLLAAWMANVPARDLALPCAVFVASRLVYAALYWAGVKYVRTVAWAASLVGLLWLGALAARA